MPKELITQGTSEYNQTSFIGGMNLLLNDTHLQPNQYRVLFNGRNRYDRLDLVLSSAEDKLAPFGVKQGMVTFGEFEILFVSGKAYYKYYTSTKWTIINGFSMSAVAPRYWMQMVPVSETNYVRVAASYTNPTGSGTLQANAAGAIAKNNVIGAAMGDIPGLLVQDNINQPRFIFLGDDGMPTVRTTQKFEQWHITFTDPTNTVVAKDGDQREYVPIGNAMAIVDGILYITSPDTTLIYRSVEGRPLDFVVNVVNTLADHTTSPPFTQFGGGDANTTSYSVGVGGITCLRQMSDGSLFVSASNANFSVAKNFSPDAPKIFGEYTFIRKFLFNANCLSDRAILDSVGDTKFIDLTGVRSFNAIQQSQGNEGRNSPFTATIQAAFQNIVQNPTFVAAILYDDYELYAVNTIFGPVIAVYDTINSCWTGFDIDQCKGKRIKQLVKIELAFQALFAITEDDKIYRLYIGPDTDNGQLRTDAICSNILYVNINMRMANPKLEVKLTKTRIIVDNITEDCSLSFTPYINNREAAGGTQTKNFTYKEPLKPTTNQYPLPDVDTQLENALFSTPDCEQGWKVYGVIEWTSGSLTQFSMELQDITPQNPLNSQQ